MIRLAALVLMALLASGCASMALSGYGQGGAAPDSRDASIAAQVNRALVVEPAVRALDVQVGVSAGVVTLSGQVADRTAAQAAIAAARGVPGVRRVVSHLSWNE